MEEYRPRPVWMDVPIQEPKPTTLEKVWQVCAYTSVVVGVGVAAFFVTPAHSAGSQGRDVKVIHVSPSIVQYGGKIERKMRADIARDNNKAVRSLELENQRSTNRRALEADKAYYQKLKDQRKAK